ncbi:MAG: RICIN domain-containing protein [Fimbriimonas sp.]|nr:RICIN domain-containing protein [Fimbriimonas sp.]
MIVLLAAGLFPSAIGQISGTFEIVNANSGMLLDDPAASNSNGTAMDQWTGNGGTNQRWTISSAGNGQYSIVNKQSGLALEVFGQSASTGAIVDQWSYWGGANQKWSFLPAGDGLYEIANANSRLPLEVAGTSLSDGGAIDQGTWQNTAKQKWILLAENVTGTVRAGSKGSGEPAHTFHGFNWADNRDNYVDGPLLLGGLTIDDSYVTAKLITTTVLTRFRGVGANAIRIPVNPATAIGTWWKTYKGVIDQATSMGFRVLVANWTGAGNAGTANDLPSCFKMWDIVVTAYNFNPNVYFEILNEPYGYSASDWLAYVSQWLSRYPTVPRGRVFVGGTGYCQNVPAVASSKVTSGCLFSCHAYGFWNSGDTSSTNWYNGLSGEVGGYSSRTVLTEFGADMREGWNYLGGDQGNNAIASVNGLCSYCHDHSMGSVYWPGLRTGDWYSMFQLNGAHTALILQSSSGLAVVQHGWN